jgi:hypothetical protein
LYFLQILIDFLPPIMCSYISRPRYHNIGFHKNALFTISRSDLCRCRVWFYIFRERDTHHAPWIVKPIQSISFSSQLKSFFNSFQGQTWRPEMWLERMFCPVTVSKFTILIQGPIFRTFFPWKVIFRGISWKKRFFKTFSAENYNFSQHYWGGKFSAEFSPKFSQEKMYEKSAPGANRTTFECTTTTPAL